MNHGYYSHDNHQQQQQQQHEGYRHPQNQPGWGAQPVEDANRQRQVQLRDQLQHQHQHQHQNQQALPPGWVEASDPNTGKVYYCNPQTRETKWERPTIMTTFVAPRQPGNPISHHQPPPQHQQQQQQQQGFPPGWVEAKDSSSGKAYYCNPQTRETKWERPTINLISAEFHGNRNDNLTTTTSRTDSSGSNVHHDSGSVLGMNRGCHEMTQTASLSTMATTMEANSSSNNYNHHDTDGAVNGDDDLDELQSMTTGQIAHLIKLQQRQQKEQQSLQSQKGEEVEVETSSTMKPLDPYTPIHLSSMSLLSTTERVEPGRLDVRMHALREELKTFGYQASSSLTTSSSVKY